MTLHTRIAVLAPIPVRELFEFVNRELLHTADTIVEDEENTSFDIDHFKATGERRWLPNGTWNLGNKGGQGFDAWFWIEYRPDGPLRSEDVYEEDDGPRYVIDPAMALEINFDTGYAFKDSATGAGCGDLHAWYITRLAEWFAERHVEWSWYNEFTGEWHGEDLSALTALDRFGRHELGDPSKLAQAARRGEVLGLRWTTTGA